MEMCTFQNQIKLILSILLIKKVEQACLETKDSTECCADFYFVNGTCKPCEPGFFGPNCRAACPYPRYGRRCAEMCDCPEDQCDLSAGCKQNPLQLSTATNSSPNRKSNTQAATTFEYGTEQNTGKNDVTDSRSANSPISENPLGTSSLLLIVILSSISSLFISVVVSVFVVCHRTWRSKGRQNSLRRRSTASHRRPATSYYEIDESSIALGTRNPRQSSEDMYVHLEKTKVEKSNYATLSQLPEESDSHI